MTRSVWVRFNWERKWIVIKSLRENWKYLKTDPVFAKHAFLWLKWVANKSLGLAAKTLKDKIVKNFLSVFRDWKVYLRGSRELSRENLWVTLATGPSTREQVAKIDPRTRDWGLTWLTRDWVAKIGQKWNFEILRFLEQNTFRKYLKHSKIFLYLN